MKLVILDRDGVINEDSDEFIKSLAEWKPIPGSIDAMARLYHAGFKLVVATNQSGIARGYYSHDTLASMHDRLQALLAEHGAKIEALFYCPHGPQDACDCRKPKPGLLLRAQQSLGLSLAGVPAIGDSQRDLDAAAAVGARPILVKTGKGLATLAKMRADSTVPVYENLSAAVDALIANRT